MKTAFPPLFFSVADFSSEEQKHGVSNLTSLASDNRGWQSEKESRFPQFVMIDLQTNHFVEKLQILSH